MQRTAFTIIEVLVAITIIAILATLATVTYSTSKRTSRDSRRKSDITTYAQAIQQYSSVKDSFFIELKPGCTTPLPTSTTCTGANGESYGRVNFTGTEDGLQYSTKSIAQDLQSLGFLQTIAFDPASDQKLTSSGQPDYVYVRCQTQSAAQSVTKIAGDSAAIWTQLETPSGLTQANLSNTEVSCGSDTAPSRFAFGYTAPPTHESATRFPAPNPGSSDDKTKGYFALPIGLTH